MATLFWQGFWRLADPKISLASFAGLFLAACMAQRDQGLAWGWFTLTVIGVFAVEVAKNASGEIVDYDSGTDLAVSKENRSPFSGGKRVMVDGLLTRTQTSSIAGVFYVLAIAVGLFITLVREDQILLIGVAGMALAWFYHSGPLKLSYRGFGELAVCIAYGPLVVCGCYLVQTGTVTAPVIQASMVLGILVAAFLWINQFPDFEADQASSKRNLVVRVGKDKAATLYTVLMASAYLWLILTSLYYPHSMGLLWGLASLPTAMFSAWKLHESRFLTANVIPAQVASLACFVFTAVGAGMGYLLQTY
ncbi:MAG: prenyltransferase [Halioglobus sp.]